MASSNSLSKPELDNIKRAANWFADNAAKLNFAYQKNTMIDHANNLWYIANKFTTPPTKGETDGTPEEASAENKRHT